MAIILLRVAFGQVVGISVDTHVHRIANQLGWAGQAGTKQPEQTRKVLEGWMPREVWGDVNLRRVGLGQEVQTLKGLQAYCAHARFLRSLLLADSCPSLLINAWQVQTEKPKLLAKCLASSDPPRALRLAVDLGVDVRKEVGKAKLPVPEGVPLPG